MKRLLLLLLAAACDSYRPPVIELFAVDDSSPSTGPQLKLKFIVHDAAIISIVPEPGEVTSSPVTVTPRGPTTYTLRAGNLVGWVSKDLIVSAQATGGATILQFSAVPSQGPAGTPRLLAWSVRDSLTLTLSGGGMPLTEVPATGQMTITPGLTTSYVLAAASVPPFNAVVGHAVARVVEAAAITSFTASPTSILQGEAVTLSWEGTALSWTIDVGGVDSRLGTAKSLVVRPPETTTYTLTGAGPGGTSAPQPLTVSVTPRAGTTLDYTPPAAAPGMLKVVADACASPCIALTLRLLAAAPVSLRGVAVDLPFDSTKASVNPAGFGSALDAGAAVLGSGLLADTLVLGAAKKGTGTAPAADTALATGAEVAHFTLVLRPAGGQGVIFDGASVFKAFVQSASGRTAGGIAVGKLEAK